MTDSTIPVRLEKQTGPLLIAGLGVVYNCNGPMDIPAQWARTAPWLGKIEGQKNKVAYGLCTNEEAGVSIEYLSGVEVTTASGLPPGFICRELPSVDYAVFTHPGTVATLKDTINYIWKVGLAGSGYKADEAAGYFFERYGPLFDPSTGQGDISVWIPVI